MKPDWKDAPEWANWLAMDRDGDWFWYANKPELSVGRWGADGDCKPCQLPEPENTLERRP